MGEEDKKYTAVFRFDGGEALSAITGDHMVTEKAKQVIAAQETRGDAQEHESGEEG